MGKRSPREHGKELIEMADGKGKNDEMFPKVRRGIENFLSDQEGNIPRNKMGTIRIHLMNHMFHILPTFPVTAELPPATPPVPRLLRALPQ